MAVSVVGRAPAAAEAPVARSAAPNPPPDGVDPQRMVLELALGGYPSGLGTRGIVAHDVTEDGIPEIFVGHSHMFYMVGWDPSTRFSQRWYVDAGPWSVPYPPVSIHRIAVAGIGRGSVVAALTDDSDLLYYEAPTGRSLGSHKVQAGSSNYFDLELADVDPSPGVEAIVLTDQSLAVYPYLDPQPLWSLTTLGGMDLAVGQMDGDPSIEIAVQEMVSGMVSILDAGSLAIEWRSSAAAGLPLGAGDLDGDGKDELVAARYLECRAFDVDTGTMKWSIPTSGIDALEVADSTGDGVAEVILGDEQRGKVRGRDGQTGGLLWEVANPDYGVADIAAADFDGDCRPDVAFGSGYASSGPDQFVIADVPSRAVDWRMMELAGPWWAFGVADVDADGLPELLRVATTSGYGGAAPWMTDLHHRVDEYVPSRALNGTVQPTETMAIAELDGDPALEYVIHDGDLYDQHLSAFDGLTHTRQWTQTAASIGETAASAAADLDGDGDVEILVGVHRGILYELDGGTGAIRWQQTLSTAWPAMGLWAGDVDGDGRAEIVATASDAGARVFDGATHALLWSTAITGLTSVDVGDADGDGDADIVAGADDGRIRVWDGSAKTLLFTASSGTQYVHAVRAGRVDPDARPEIVFAAGTQDTGDVGVLDTALLAVSWRSSRLPGFVGRAGGLFVGDADGDARVEIVVSAGLAVRVYEYDALLFDTQPPAWSGAPGVASVVPIGCCLANDVLWSLATDAGHAPVVYQVHRDTDPAFVPSPSNLVAEVERPSYRDAGLAGGAPYYYVVRARDAAGNTDTNTAKAGAIPGFMPIDPPSLPPGTAGTPYAQTLTASGGTPPHTWSVTAGTLPPGLSLPADTGVLSGTPMASGTYGFSVMVLDALGCSGSRAYTLVIAPHVCGRVDLTPSTLPSAWTGTAYGVTLGATGGVPPYTFAVASGSLPAGLTLATDGTLSGTPAVPGSSTFTVRATDAFRCTGTATYLLAVDLSRDFVAGEGLGPTSGNRVRVHTAVGVPTGVDFQAYAAARWGTNVAAADIDGGPYAEMVTGPGPGDVYGPQVRGFDRAGAPLPKVSYYAYGTLRFGVNVAAQDLDADGFAEILTGPGPGVVFGPHVRGWNFDGVVLAPMGIVSFHAYGTLRYGTNVTAGSVDGDVYGEILTGSGPGATFAPQVRGFDHDLAAARPIAGINFWAFATQGYGANVASGAVDGDAFHEIGAAPGPGPSTAFPPRYAGFDYDGTAVAPKPGFDLTLPAGTSYGGRLWLGDVTLDDVAELLAGLGRDPAADAAVRPYAYSGSALTPILPYNPFPAGRYGVNPCNGALGY